MEITANDIQRVKTNWENISKEVVKVEFISGTLYGYCTELASLRLLKAYRGTDKSDCGYSENLETHYFRLETDL